MAATVGTLQDATVPGTGNREQRLPGTLGLDLLGSPWRLVLIVGLPIWLAAAAFRILGIYLISQDAPPGIFVLPVTPRILQHLVMVPILLLAYRMALAIGWPARHRLAAASGHLALATAVSALGRPALVWVSVPYLPAESMPAWESMSDMGFKLWLNSTMDFQLAYVFGLAAMAFLHMFMALQRTEIERRRLQGAWTEARLLALRMQLNPHFLFNAFNLVVTMLDRDPAKARAVMLSLSELFRRTLETMDETWGAFGDELTYAREYLKIQAARLGSRLSFEIDVARELEGVRVPAMLLQPLVENAVVHGTDDDQATLHVWIKAAWEQAGGRSRRLRVEIGNHTSGRLDGGRGVPGVGLSTTRDRLEACYGERATLQFGPASASSYCVTLSLPAAAAESGGNSIGAGTTS